jgi:hypothetical protein
MVALRTVAGIQLCHAEAVGEGDGPGQGMLEKCFRNGISQTFALSS